MSDPKVELHWGDPNEIEKEYVVYRSTEPFGVEEIPSPLMILNKNSTYFLDTDVTEGVEYFYRVSARGGNIEAISNIVSVVATSCGIGEVDIFGDQSIISMYNFNDNIIDENLLYDGTIKNNTTAVYTNGGICESKSISFNNSYFITTAPFSSRYGAISFWIRNIDLSTANPVFFASFTFSLNERRVTVFDNNNGTSYNSEYHFNGDSILGDVWSHIVITIDNNVPSLYINNILQTWTLTDTNRWTGQINNGSIGGYDVINQGDTYSRGVFEMELFRMFNRPLTDNEVNELYLEGAK